MLESSKWYLKMKKSGWVRRTGRAGKRKVVLKRDAIDKVRFEQTLNLGGRVHEGMR